MKTGKLIREAIFSSGTERYVSPMEPGINEQVVIRCRTGKDNADKVYLVTEDKKIRMEKEESTKLPRPASYRPVCQTCLSFLLQGCCTTEFLCVLLAWLSQTLFRLKAQ